MVQSDLALGLLEAVLDGLITNGKFCCIRRIAGALLLSLHAVRTHIQNMLLKLGVDSTLDAVNLALTQGWATGRHERDALAMGRLEGTDVLSALQQLPPDQREVLLLQMVAGLSAPEMATLLGMTVSRVKAARHRGLSRLARALDVQSVEHLRERPPSPDPDHLANREERRG